MMRYGGFCPTRVGQRVLNISSPPCGKDRQLRIGMGILRFSILLCDDDCATDGGVIERRGRRLRCQTYFKNFQTNGGVPRVRKAMTLDLQQKTLHL